MSIAEYVAKLDEDQLSNLIDKATARREDIRQSGWVKLWVVNISWANIAWFAEGDHAAAIERACAEVKKAAAERPGRGIEMEVSLEKFRPNDAEELLAPRRAAAQGTGEADAALKSRTTAHGGAQGEQRG